MCEFLVKSQMSYEHLKRGNLKLIFQLTITLGAEERILLQYGIMYMKSNEASVCCSSVIWYVGNKQLEISVTFNAAHLILSLISNLSYALLILEFSV